MSVPETREEISITDSLQDVLVKMAEGNPGALSALLSMKDDPDLLITALMLDDMNMRGSQVWVAYKYACGGDKDSFKERVMARDPELVKAVNAETGCGNWLAVEAGASVHGRHMRDAS